MNPTRPSPRTESERLERLSAAARNILIVDDHTLMRSALRALLESSLGHHVVEADSGPAALDAIEHQNFDIVLLDVRMPGRDGLWTLGRIRALRPRLPVVMLSYFEDRDCVREALDLGAAGYLVKGAELYQVTESISTAIDGSGVYLHPAVAASMVSRDEPTIAGTLTHRERDVLQLLVQGATNDEIAQKLFVTEKTVKTHISGLFRKLGVTNRTQAATKALRDHLVFDEPSDISMR